MSNNNVYASYNGSQKGFSIRDLNLNQLSFVSTGIDFSSIAAGPNNDVYLTSANHIYHYNTNGTLIKDMAFPIDSIIYTGVVVKGDKVFATYEGSQKGVTIRDLALNQLSSFNTGVEAGGIAAGPDDDVFVTAQNHILHYRNDGTLLKDMAFPVTSINYTDVTVIGDKVVVSYNGSQKGFSVRDLTLTQLSYVATSFDIEALAAGPNLDVYLTCANHIYNYSLSGNQITDMEFPINSINYSGVGVIATVLS